MTEVPAQKRPVTLTRKDLFEQVWRNPMSRLADEYGISGNGLTKICDRLNIPYPPRGYWAKKAAGKKVATYRLPEAGAGIAATVTITPTPPPIAPPVPTPEVATQVEAIKASAASIVVPDHLTRPHPIIAAWLADHDRRKQEARRERDPLMRRLVDPREFSPDDRRRHRILDTLFKALERHWGCSRQHIYNLVAEGALRHFRVGSLIRIRMQDVEAYEANSLTPEPQATPTAPLTSLCIRLMPDTWRVSRVAKGCAKRRKRIGNGLGGERRRGKSALLATPGATPGNLWGAGSGLTI